MFCLRSKSKQRKAEQPQTGGAAGGEYSVCGFIYDPITDLHIWRLLFSQWTDHLFYVYSQKIFWTRNKILEQCVFLSCSRTPVSLQTIYTQACDDIAFIA